MRRPDDKPEIKEALKGRIEDLCRRVLPDGRIEGRLWVSDNPVCPEPRKPPALKVALAGDRGAWKCWRSGAKGDVLGLISYTQGLEFPETMSFARDFLGIRRMTLDERRTLKVRAEASAAEAAEKAARRERLMLEAGRRMFADAMEATAIGRAGRPTSEWTDVPGAAQAHALAYWRARRIEAGRIAQLDRSSFRFSPRTEVWTMGQYRREENGRRVKVANGPEFPAIHAAMRTPTGILQATHVTFLDPVAPAKAKLPKPHMPKLMRGPPKGCVIRISHGPEGLVPELSSRPFPLILCEGIETGLSLALAIPEARVWAAGSLGNIGEVATDFAFVSHVFVAGDNDWGSRQAQADLARVLERLAAGGKPVVLMESHAEGDFNELLQGEDA